MLKHLSNVPRDYAWGSTTLLSELEGRNPSDVPEAEVWFGDHPADPADTPDGSLRDLTGGTLPYLLKLLAAGAPLSIQVHPSIPQAQEGFAREEAAGIDIAAPGRNYRDRNHKPELIVALSDRFEALVGLRLLDDTRRLLAVLGNSAGVVALESKLQGSDPLRTAIEWALTDATPAEIDDVISAVHTAESEEFADTLAALRRVAEHNPGDGGVLVALLMNHRVLSPGEALYLPAGVLHAYLSGLGVEIMAASDNVLRGGLTPKHIDVPELLRVLDSTPEDVSVMSPDAAASIASYEVPIPDFALRRVELGDDAVELEVTTPAIVLVTRRNVMIAAGEERAVVAPGGAVFVDGEVRLVRLEGPGQVFVAEAGSFSSRHAGRAP